MLKLQARSLVIIIFTIRSNGPSFQTKRAPFVIQCHQILVKSAKTYGHSLSSSESANNTDNLGSRQSQQTVRTLLVLVRVSLNSTDTLGPLSAKQYGDSWSCQSQPNSTDTLGPRQSQPNNTDTLGSRQSQPNKGHSCLVESAKQYGICSSSESAKRTDTLVLVRVAKQYGHSWFSSESAKQYGHSWSSSESPNSTDTLVLVRSQPNSTDTLGPRQSQPNNTDTLGSRQSQPNSTDTLGPRQSQLNSTDTLGPRHNQPNSLDTLCPRQCQPNSTDTLGLRQSQPNSTDTLGPRQSQPNNTDTLGSRQSQPNNTDTLGPRQSQPNSTVTLVPRQSQPNSTDTLGPRQSQPNNTDTLGSRQSQLNSTDTLGPRQNQPNSTDTLGPRQSQPNNTDTLGSRQSQPNSTDTLGPRQSQLNSTILGDIAEQTTSNNQPVANDVVKLKSAKIIKPAQPTGKLFRKEGSVVDKRVHHLKAENEFIDEKDLTTVVKVTDDIYILSAVASFNKEYSSYSDLILTGWDAREKETRIGELYPFCCYLVYNDSSVVTAVAKSRPRNILVTRFYASQYSCRLSGKKPSHVIFQACKLEQATPQLFPRICDTKCLAERKHLKILYPEVKEGKLAVCTKIVYGKTDIQALVEWFEIQKLLGVHKVFALVKDDANADVVRLLQYYENAGFVELYPMQFVRKVHQPYVHNRPWYLAEGDIARHHCFNMMRGYSFASVIDFDEIFVPKTQNTLLQMLQKELIPDFENPAAFKFSNEMFLSNDDMEVNKTGLFLGRHLYRLRTLSATVENRTKLIYIPSKTIWTEDHFIHPTAGYKTLVRRMEVHLYFYLY
ncbi:hypothetical protein ScPMuIL_000105 [Solemya velum]